MREIKYLQEVEVYIQENEVFEFQGLSYVKFQGKPIRLFTEEDIEEDDE